MDIDRFGIHLQKKVAGGNCFYTIVGDMISFKNRRAKGEPSLFFDFTDSKKVVMKCTFFNRKDEKETAFLLSRDCKVLKNKNFLKLLNCFFLGAGSIDWKDFEKEAGQNLSKIL